MVPNYKNSYTLELFVGVYAGLLGGIYNDREEVGGFRVIFIDAIILRMERFLRTEIYRAGDMTV